MQSSNSTIHKQVGGREWRLLLTALSIPFAFFLLAYIRNLLEYYFRFSKEWRFIYSYGSMFGLLLQMAAVVLSIAFFFHTLNNRKNYIHISVVILSLVIALSPALLLLYVSFLSIIE